MLTPDEVVYATLLVLSVPFGCVIRLVKDAKQRQLLCGVTGFLIVAIVCRWHLIHSLVTMLINSAIIVLFKRRSNILSFIWCFGYLAFFRTTYLFGIPRPPALSNAVQLLMTLKMVGVAFEVTDTHHRNQKTNNTEEITTEQARLQHKYEDIHPSFLDLCLYSYCYIGILTGPYYKYKVYIDMIEDTKFNRTIPTVEPMLNRIKFAALYGLVFILCSDYFSIEYAASDEFYDQPFWYILFYMVPMFVTFRMRMYSAWVLSECLCMTAGLGVYPIESSPRSGQGPSDLKKLEESETKDSIEYDYETVHNLREWGCEVSPTVREGMRSWNMTVQYWLATYVYRRVPVKSMRTVITMSVSAFWHGIHPGYYLSFLLVPFIVWAEDLMANSYRKHTTPQRQKIYDCVSWILKMRAFEYMAMGFLLLTFEGTVRYWHSIYFMGHVLTLFFIVLAQIKIGQPADSHKVE